jgi:hypothetical protein
MSLFNHINGGGISTVIPPGDDARDITTGRLLKHLTPRQLEVVLERNPNLRVVEPVLPRETTPLPRDPVAHDRKTAPTKPVVKRHQSERAIAVAWHEAFHAGAGIYYGLRVSSSTIIPDAGADGCTLVQDVKAIAPTLHGLVMLAGQEGDAIGGFRLSAENYVTDNADVGGSPEWREALRGRLRSDLPKFIGGVTEIARQLLAKETLSEFQIKSAYLTGQRRGVAVQRPTPAPTQMKVGATNKQPQRGRVLREFNMANPKDAADFAAMMGRKASEEVIGITGGYIVQGSYR